MNFYAILGISPDADDDAVRAAYHHLARRYHPDRGLGSSSEKFREVTAAYETLRDPQRRAVYDRGLRVRPPAARVPVEPLGAPWPVRPSFDRMIDDLFRAFWEDDPFFFGPRRW
jgi:curved DNA-binding protein CbpA